MKLFVIAEDANVSTIAIIHYNTTLFTFDFKLQTDYYR